MDNDVAISVKNLTKTYRIFGHPGDRIKQALTFGQKQYHKEFTALKDVSFEIKKGETVGIIGRNGSGKSTLLQLICGILKPTSGMVEVNGRISALLELGAGFNPEFTGRENVYFQGALTGFTKQQMDERFDAIAAFANIGEFIDQPVRTYSSGMFVRLAFAAMAHMDANILLIDEALAVGDMHFTQKCMRFFNTFKCQGTLLFVSHDIANITALCDRVVWLDGGMLRRQDDTKSVCEDYLNVMVGPATSGDSAGLVPEDAQVLLDQRREFLNSSNLRNDLEVFNFKLPDEYTNSGKARIMAVSLTDLNEQPYRWVVGGEIVTLQVKVHISVIVEKPILGFTVKDQLGRSIFGDNTYLAYIDKTSVVLAGCDLKAKFTFVMPRLPSGQYSVRAALADGTQSQYEMLDWCHDSLIITSRCSSATGDLGLPMINISLETIPLTEGA